MKYAILIPDGCADRPIDSLGGRTPMQAARTPNLDALARSGIVGRSHNVPKGLSPGSDVATLGLLGYDPARYYTGRAPLEAVAQGIELGPEDWAIRCNLVAVRDGVMKSFTAGHISSEEATTLIEALNEGVAGPSPVDLRFYPGVGYRNLAVLRATPAAPAPFSAGTETFPPHDFTDRRIDAALPLGAGAGLLRDLMEESRKVLEDHPVNRRRIALGRPPATQAWLWGLGKKPQLPPFAEKNAAAIDGKPLRGAMITAVDLLRGIASLIGWETVDVPGITGYVDTDYAAKGRYAAETLRTHDLVCVHVEATDEAGHEGDVEKKIAALERIDAEIVPPLVDALKSHGAWRLLVSPDHPTPVALKTHTSDFVPWLLTGTGIEPGAAGLAAYDEETARNSAVRFDRGCEMIDLFLRLV